MARHTRVFFYSVYLVLGLIWVSTVAWPAWRPASEAVPFTLLLLLHGVLHALMDRLEARGWAAPYLVVQILLAGVLVWLGEGSPMAEVLFAPIAGEAIGLFPDGWRRSLALGGVVAGLAGAIAALQDPLPILTRLPFTGLAFGFAALYVVLYLRQMRERERAESLVAQLQEAHVQLQAYAARIAELTVTQERQRMARELHDTLAQGLAGLVMQLEAVDELLARGELDRARDLLQRAMGRARRTHGEARARIQSLRLPVERLDLAAELRRELERAQVDGGFTGALEVGPGDTAPEGEAAVQHYYIAREAIANAVRHSRASQLRVRLWGEDGRVCLSVADDGVGFDPEAPRLPGHFGLTGARAVGGELHIESSPGQGTTLFAAVPLRPAGGARADGAAGGGDAGRVGEEAGP